MSRGLADNVLSGMKAGFKAILDILKHPFEKEKMFIQKNSSTLSATLLALILMVAAFGFSPAVAAEMVLDPSTGEMVEAPQYGGSITYARANLGEHTDVWHIGGFAHHWISEVVEKLVIGDWAIDRNKYDWRTMDQPFSVLRGALAERWFTPDPTTIIVHIRKGVHWHDKAPMNGRALTASDVEFNFHRLYGLGSGFTKAGSFNAGIEKIVESVTATDDSTVVFKLTNPGVNALQKIFDWWTSVIYPPEVIKQHGDIKDWRNLVGTGPMELTDVVEGQSLKWTRVPNYWGFDEKFPQNRLPYVDEINALFMPDPAARLAALRSGRVDVLGTAGDSQLRSIDQIKSLHQANPEINTWTCEFRSEHAFAPNNINKPPFNDIRVRRAMQMALDLETISQTYFSGLANPTPQAFLNNAKLEIGTPFEEWPEEIKPYYRYDPEGAKQLLAEAGYPNGFTTRLDCLDRFDFNYVEIAASYWSEIGVKVKIQPIDGTQHTVFLHENSSDGLVAWTSGLTYDAIGQSRSFTTESIWNPVAHDDSEYDALWNAANTAPTIEEQNRLLKKANMRIAEQHWIITGPVGSQFNVAQPWVKGYNGEIRIGEGNFSTLLTRVWIDQALKQEMGF